MSQKLVSAILLALTFLAVPAFAQTGVPLTGDASSSTANKTDTLTPEQAKRALATLQDDQKRAQVIETLRAIANASPPAQAAASETVKPPAIPLTADSLGAQLLATVSDQIGDISHQVADIAHSLTHFKAFYWWFIRTANDPKAYGQLLDIAWKLALVFGCAFIAEWLIFRLVKRPLALLEARIPQAARAPAQTLADPPSSAADVMAETEPQRRRLGLTRAWQSMIRLPFVVGHLLLELLPVVVFVGIATMLLGTGIGDMRTTRLVILAVMPRRGLGPQGLDEAAIRSLFEPSWHLEQSATPRWRVAARSRARRFRLYLLHR